MPVEFVLKSSCKYNKKEENSLENWPRLLVATRALRDLLLQAMSIKIKKKRNVNSSFVQSCKFVTDYRTFMKDFLKVVDFLHYLKAEGYDMVTFDKVGNGIKS